MRTVSDYFGCMVFDDRMMRAKLSAEVYASLRKTIDEEWIWISEWPTRWRRQ